MAAEMEKDRYKWTLAQLYLRKENFNAARELIDEVLPLHRQTSFPVAVNGRAHGILALEDLKPLPREKWHTTQVKDAMRTINPQLFVDTSATFEFAKEMMKDNGTGSLAVVNNQGELVGFLQSGKVTKRSKKSLSNSATRS